MAETFGELQDASTIAGDREKLVERFERDGYLYFRSALPRDVVLAARAALLSKLSAADGLDHSRPVDDAVANSRHDLTTMDQPTPWWIGLTRTPEYRKMCHHPNLLALSRAILGAPVRVVSYYALRFMQPGPSTGVHADRAYIRGTPNVLTAWIPLGDTPRSLGPLRVMAGSHRDLARSHEKNDHFAIGIGADELEAIRERCGGSWLTTDFAAGDVLIFSMNTLHGGLDNRDPAGRMRISTDVRFQRESEPIDERFAGDGTPTQACEFGWNAAPVEAAR